VSASQTRLAILASIASCATQPLADTLLEEFDEIQQRYAAGDLRPSELGGARFSEAAFRICQQVCIGRHTPVGKGLPRVDRLLAELEAVPTASADDTFRLHIPRTLRLIYDLRNKRDVAHLGAGVSPNHADAELVLSCAGWVVAEIVRVAHQCSADEAQAIVDALVERRTPLLYDDGDIVRVLDPSLKYKDQVLLVLHHFHPESATARRLFEIVGYSHFGQFQSRILKGLHREAYIHLEDDRAKILPPGIATIQGIVRSHLND
jgi:hypothetical protein